MLVAWKAEVVPCLVKTLKNAPLKTKFRTAKIGLNPNLGVFPVALGLELFEWPESRLLKNSSKLASSVGLACSCSAALVLQCLSSWTTSCRGCSKMSLASETDRRDLRWLTHLSHTYVSKRSCFCFAAISKTQICCPMGWRLGRWRHSRGSSHSCFRIHRYSS